MCKHINSNLVMLSIENLLSLTASSLFISFNLSFAQNNECTQTLCM